MPLVKCPDCGNDISPSAPSCPRCGRPQSAVAPAQLATPTTAKKKIPPALVAVIVGAILWIIFRTEKNADNPSTSPGPDTAGSVSATAQPAIPTVAPEAAVQLPSDEAALVRIITGSQQEAAVSENDMQKGGVKHRRDTDICSLMQRLSVNDWVGTIQTIDANSDGKGVLKIAIAKDILV